MKRALLIGIDAYDSFRNLTGCVNDVRAMMPLIARNADGSPNFDCRMMISGRDAVGRRDLNAAIDKLLAPNADVALLYFAGHGISAASDVCIASSDGDQDTPGVPLSWILGKAQSSPVKHVIIILDCCHAGAGGGSAMLGSNVSLIRDGLALLAAASPQQIAAETADHRGLFSFHLCGALEGGAADVTGKVSLAGVYARLAECFGSWDQRPTFKANLDESFELRRASPFVPLEKLRLLPDIFASADADLALDPTFERESLTSVLEHVSVYDVLSNYRDAKLIELIGEQYLYYAAMNSKSCRLTPLGRHYWQMANKGLI